MPLPSPPSLPYLDLCLRHSQSTSTSSSLLHDFLYFLRLTGHICHRLCLAGEKPQHHVQSRSFPCHCTLLNPLLCPHLGCDTCVSWYIIQYTPGSCTRIEEISALNKINFSMLRCYIQELVKFSHLVVDYSLQ